MSGTEAHVPFAGCLTKDPSRSRLALVGIADDTQSSFRRGSARGPEHIRSAYDGRSFNSTCESGVNLAGLVLDMGDLEPRDSWSTSARQYRTAVESLLREGKTPFVAGGDHAVTVPVVAALRVLDELVHVIQIDAHPDLYPEFQGSPDSHGCVAARVLEMDHVASLTQIGIRAMNEEQAAQAARFQTRLRMHFARDCAGNLPRLEHISKGSPVYITVDLDGFDPAFAPGVSHPVPGGLTSRQVLSLIQGGHWNLVGMDVVELNPSTDFHGLTAILAGRLLHEAMGYVTLHPGGSSSV